MLIDLNADLGERPEAVDEDLQILASITSANLACGFHAGDLETMLRLCEAARRAGVAVGAHVSYRDRKGFGRRHVEVEPAQLTLDVIEQLAALAEAAQQVGASLAYVKPHGALYNRCRSDRIQSRALIDATLSFDSSLRVVGMPSSALAEIAVAQGLEAISEGYADRGYLADGGLVPRGQPGALLEAKVAIAQALDLIRGFVIAADGSRLALAVRSLCLHGDTPDAPTLAAALRGTLEQAGVTVQAF